MLRGALDRLTRALIGTLLCASSAVHAQTPPQAPATPPPQAAPATPSAPTQPVTPPAEPTPIETAAPAAEGPSLEAKERARIAYSRGQSAFSEGRFAEALEAFQAAFASVPNPIVLLSVAEAHARLGQLPQGIAALHKYLELNPTAADRAAVEAKIATWSATPGVLAIATEPAGAALTLDGVVLAERTPAQVELSPGQHTLSYSLTGYETGTETVALEPGIRQELTIALRPAAALPVAAAAVAATPKKAEPPMAAIWITGSLGAAGIITGTVLGFMALDAQSDFDSNPTEETADRGERLALFADVGFGVGVMALATAAVLMFTSDEMEEEAAPDVVPSSARLQAPRERAQTGLRLDIIPQFSPTTAAATARVQF
jgi:tetratricopeptide (TPR) repeat protein